MQSSRLLGCWKMYCSIFHSFFHSFFKISRGAGSQFSFFSWFFTSFLMVYVYKNEQKMDQKWEPWAPLLLLHESTHFFKAFWTTPWSAPHLMGTVVIIRLKCLVQLELNPSRTLIYSDVCLISLQMESMKFGWRFNPFWVHNWPVGSEVQSHLHTFVAAVDLNSKILTLQQFHLPLRPT